MKTINFPQTKKIDWSNYIEPKKQILVKTNAGTIAVLVSNK